MACIKGRLKGVASINDLIEYVREFEVTKQDKLVNQLNIKSINGESILGKGNLDVLSTLGNYVKDAEVNGSTLTLKNQDGEVVVSFTPITKEDRDNLDELSKVIEEVIKIDELKSKVEKLEEDVQVINEWAESLSMDGGEVK